MFANGLDEWSGCGRGDGLHMMRVLIRQDRRDRRARGREMEQGFAMEREDREREVLRRVMDVLDDAITDLPASSEWHAAFHCARRELATAAGLSLVSLAQTPLLDLPAA